MSDDLRTRIAAALKAEAERRGIYRIADFDFPFMADAVIRELRPEKKRARRHIDSELLRSVAEAYRKHFDYAPVEAVAQIFEVQPRMAHEYVRRARLHGFLPPTTQGKKNA